MASDILFYDPKAAKRLNCGIVCAVLLHLCVLIAISVQKEKVIITPDLRSMPTSVNIRFSTRPPPPEPMPIQTVQTLQKPPPVERKIVKREKPVTPEPVKTAVAQPKPEQLNRIEPAAPPAPVPVEPVQPREIAPPRLAPPAPIPVITDVRLKGRRITPEYPRRALRLGQEGLVRLHVLVSETGAQKDIKIVKHSGFALLDEAALKAVRQWSFEPTRIGGRPVMSWVEVPVEFKIN